MLNLYVRYDTRFNVVCLRGAVSPVGNCRVISFTLWRSLGRVVAIICAFSDWLNDRGCYIRYMGCSSLGKILAKLICVSLCGKWVGAIYWYVSAQFRRCL